MIRARRALPTARAAAAWLLTASPCAAAADAGIVELRFSHFLGPQSFFQTELVEPWSRELERRTNGRVRVTILSGADPTGDVRLQSAHVRTGTVDIALGLRGAEDDGRFPGSSIVELPGLAKSGECGARLLWPLLVDGTIAQEYAGLQVLALFTQNPAGIHTRSVRVERPGDLAGLRIRASNEFVAGALEALGASPQRSNVPTAIGAQLASGELDGVVTNWGNPIPGFETLVRHHTAVHVAAPVFFVVMNADAYAALPTDVRHVLDGMSGVAWSREIGARWNVWDARVRDRASAAGGDIRIPDADAARLWRSSLRPPVERYLQRLSARFPQAERVYRRVARESSRIGCRAE